MEKLRYRTHRASYATAKQGRNLTHTRFISHVYLTIVCNTLPGTSNRSCLHEASGRPLFEIGTCQPAGVFVTISSRGVFFRRGMEPGSEEVVFPEEEPFRTFPYRARFVYHIKSVFHARDKMQYTLRHGSWCTRKVLPYISGKKGASARCLHP